MKVSNDALTERVYSNPLYNVYTSMKKRCYTKSTKGCFAGKYQHGSKQEKKNSLRAKMGACKI